MISSAQFRDALRHFPAGVTIVTSRVGELVHGMTVSAFTSVSTAPPLIAIVIDQAHTISPMLSGEGACFAVNILAEEQAALSNRFAFLKDEDRFQAGQWTRAVTGAPVLADAVAWLDCEVRSHHPAGTHTIFVGDVMASSVARPEAAPLVYWNRDYRRVVPFELGEGTE